ncbi:class II glutamine amidotransferase [Chitinilyticum piscinae]|uniref:Class II glutamine amidotransferase n=1 Tax=Chitinilyticum piscinae TaxID=2866724 RepID=A0A8J7K2C8_9NEIS|nr:class II glutamine amidotransferase [Chitinilyticum piscinae]MBE9609862.1 class II glutamine amidotransferase [Chitinilyticum piscinae]
MCQLLAMNCNVPTDIAFSFEGFRRRGGQTDQHGDGWGIGFFEDDGWRVFLDHLPSATSPVAEFIRNYPIKSHNVVAHIRKATQGKVSLANTHPFRRELWGEEWLFAHNGNLADFTYHGTRFQAIGNTDSEQAFCLLLDQLAERFPTKPAHGELAHEFARIAGSLTTYGTFNCLLAVGRQLYTHCSTQLHYLVRQAPFSTAHLKDADVSIDFSRHTTPDDRVAIIATLPLTDNECWSAFQSGEVACFEDGSRVL